jgi:hypothetical protein
LFSKTQSLRAKRGNLCGLSALPQGRLPRFARNDRLPEFYTEPFYLLLLFLCGKNIAVQNAPEKSHWLSML